MIELPDICLSRDEQLALLWPVSNIEPARELLPHYPACPALWRAIVVGLAAEQILWQANLKLVMHLALDAHRRNGGDVDELFQEGALALHDCLRRFRPELGYTFATYAHDGIRRRMAGLAERGAWLPGSRHFHRVRQLIRQDRAPERYNQLAMARRVDPAVLQYLPIEDEHFFEVESSSVEFIDLLPEPFRELLVKRYGLEGPAATQREVAEHFQVSTSTISRWEAAALQQARTLLEADRTTISAARTAAGKVRPRQRALAN